MLLAEQNCRLLLVEQNCRLLLPLPQLLLHLLDRHLPKVHHLDPPNL